jgi:hypothetical protein
MPLRMAIRERNNRLAKVCSGCWISRSFGEAHHDSSDAIMWQCRPSLGLWKRAEGHRRAPVQGCLLVGIGELEESWLTERATENTDAGR